MSEYPKIENAHATLDKWRREFSRPDGTIVIAPGALKSPLLSDFIELARVCVDLDDRLKEIESCVAVPPKSTACGAVDDVARFLCCEHSSESCVALCGQTVACDHIESMESFNAEINTGWLCLGCAKLSGLLR